MIQVFFRILISVSFLFNSNSWAVQSEMAPLLNQSIKYVEEVVNLSPDMNTLVHHLPMLESTRKEALQYLNKNKLLTARPQKVKAVENILYVENSGQAPTKIQFSAEKLATILVNGREVSVDIYSFKKTLIELERALGQKTSTATKNKVSILYSLNIQKAHGSALTILGLIGLTAVLGGVVLEGASCSGQEMTLRFPCRLRGNADVLKALIDLEPDYLTDMKCENGKVKSFTSNFNSEGFFKFADDVIHEKVQMPNSLAHDNLIRNIKSDFNYNSAGVLMGINQTHILNKKEQSPWCRYEISDSHVIKSVDNKNKIIRNDGTDNGDFVRCRGSAGQKLQEVSDMIPLVRLQACCAEVNCEKEVTSHIKEGLKKKTIEDEKRGLIPASKVDTAK